MRAARCIVGAGALLAAAAPAGAHEMHPGFLELRENGPGIYGFLWKKPAGGEVEIAIAPVIPPECRLTAPGQQRLTPGAIVVRGTLRCEGGIGGQDRWPSTGSSRRSRTSSSASITPTAGSRAIC